MGYGRGKGELGVVGLEMVLEGDGECGHEMKGIVCGSGSRSVDVVMGGRFKVCSRTVVRLGVINIVGGGVSAVGGGFFFFFDGPCCGRDWGGFCWWRGFQKWNFDSS